MERLIGRYGKFGAAKTFIIFAGIHGNEKAGIKALEELFADFTKNQIAFDGTIIGIAGNLKALEQNARFIHKDLNRQWYLSKIRKLGALPYGMLNTQEDIEQKEILDLILEIVHDKGKKLMLIDLHTTSAKGGCFTITNTLERSSELALQIPVPVINGMTNKIGGTTLEYFDQLGLPAIAFEAGQHEELEAVNRIKAALVSIFKHTACLEKELVKEYESSFLKMQEDFAHLPRKVNVLYRHPVEEEDAFVMEEGFGNFHRIQKGDLLARDKHGPIYSHLDGLILMPLYQKKGNDGFFIVEEEKIGYEF
ncbi:MAG: succinylglutamate desuccinylase/aspartoacylase family protein [Chitinophagales bacterium]|nr:succinylglutamate desuccinylase/aspartoacylase family protein [Chitinophagales bacterium]